MKTNLLCYAHSNNNHLSENIIKSCSLNFLNLAEMLFFQIQEVLTFLLNNIDCELIKNTKNSAIGLQKMTSDEALNKITYSFGIYDMLIALKESSKIALKRAKSIIANFDDTDKISNVLLFYNKDSILEKIKSFIVRITVELSINNSNSNENTEKIICYFIILNNFVKIVDELEKNFYIPF